MVQSNANGTSAHVSESVHATPQPARLFKPVNLVKQIYAQESPEKYIKTLPAQSLYLAMKQSGIESCGDLVDLASVQQCRLMFDFDLWSKDRFSEDNIWDWLALPDQDECDLDILHKVLHSIDLKLIALLIAKYVQIEIFEEPTDQSPGENFYTPDNGSTWIYIALEDSHKHFLFGRLLAFIFDNDAQVFYQLIAIPGVSTLSLIEEEAYQDRGRRLESEGVPNSEESAECNSPISQERLIELLHSTPSEGSKSAAQKGIEVSRSSLRTPEPLGQMIAELTNPDEFEVHLSHVMNSAIVHFGIDYCEVSDVQGLVESVKGAVNIGLEYAMTRSDQLSIHDIYSRLGLTNLYRTGIRELYKLRAAALKVKTDTKTEFFSTHLVEGLKLPLPVMPVFMDEDGTVRAEGESVPTERKAISYLKTCNMLKGLLDKLSISSPSI